MRKASVRDLRTHFPAVRAMVEQDRARRRQPRASAAAVRRALDDADPGEGGTDGRRSERDAVRTAT